MAMNKCVEAKHCISQKICLSACQSNKKDVLMNVCLTFVQAVACMLSVLN